MEQNDSFATHAAVCRALVAAAHTATLATLAREPAGFPFASLVSVADDGSGRPLMLLSTLAEHTRNLIASDEASLLFVEPGKDEVDPLMRARATLIGRCVKLGGEDKAALAAARDRYLALHPEAAGYVGFGDFALWRLEVQALRYVGGFGRMSWSSPTRTPKRAAEVAQGGGGVGGTMGAAWSIAREALRLLWRRPILGVIAVPLDEEGRLVMVRRRDSGQWCLPGGMVEWGETVERSLARELLEECGHALVSVERVVGVYSDPHRDARMHSVALVVEARVRLESRGAAPNPLEITEVRAFPPDAPPSPLAYDTPRHLADWRAGRAAVIA